MQEINLNIQTWDGNAGTLNTLNQHNFTQVQMLINQLNNLAKAHITLHLYITHFDLTLLTTLNRQARVQFLTNARNLQRILDLLKDDVLFFEQFMDYQFNTPVIPLDLYLDQTVWDTYWNTVKHDLLPVTNVVNQVIKEVQLDEQ